MQDAKCANVNRCNGLIECVFTVGLNDECNDDKSILNTKFDDFKFVWTFFKRSDNS